jgi:hypothetical protein
VGFRCAPIVGLLLLRAIAAAAVERPAAEPAGPSTVLTAIANDIDHPVSSGDPFDSGTADDDDDDDDVALPSSCVVIGPDSPKPQPMQHVSLREAQCDPSGVFHPPRPLHA